MHTRCKHFWVSAPSIWRCLYIYICTVICVYIYNFLQLSTYVCRNPSHHLAQIVDCVGPLLTSPFCPSHWPTATGNFTGGHHRLQELIVLAWHRKSNWKSMQNFQKSEKGREIFQTPFLRSCFETCRYFEATPLKKLLPTIQNHKAPTPRVDIATKKTGSTFPSKTFRQKWTSGNPKSYRLHVQITTNGTFVTHVHNDPDPPKQHRRFFVVLWLEKT